jgi:hypothetical protein
MWIARRMLNARSLVSLWIEMQPSPSISPAAYCGLKGGFGLGIDDTRSNGDDPVTEVRGAEGRSGETVPDRIEPERGQIGEDLGPDLSVADSKQVCHVLHDDEPGSKVANGSPHLSPQNGLGMPEPRPLPCG